MVAYKAFRVPDKCPLSRSGIPVTWMLGRAWEVDPVPVFYYTWPDTQSSAEMSLVSCSQRSFWSLVVKYQSDHFLHIQPHHHPPRGFISSSALAGCWPWRLGHTHQASLAQGSTLTSVQLLTQCPCCMLTVAMHWMEQALGPAQDPLGVQGGFKWP